MVEIKSVGIKIVKFSSTALKLNMEIELESKDDTEITKYNIILPNQTFSSLFSSAWKDIGEIGDKILSGVIR